MNNLQLLHGEDYVINDHISIHQPSLSEIYEYGESQYWEMVTALCTIPSDMKSILYDSGIDYETITEFQLFYILTRGMDSKLTSILFGDFIDLSKMEMFLNQENDELYLANHIYGVPIEGLVIDQHIYTLITDHLRSMHNFVKNVEKPGNEFTKKILIDEQRDRIRHSKEQPFESVLYPLIIAMVNCSDFKYDFDSVWKLKLSIFMTCVRQVHRSKNVANLMQGIYSGCIDCTKINKDDLNWM